MISYKPLLKLLIDRNMKKGELMTLANISKATVARLSTNKFVSLEVIDKLCSVLNCQPGDLLQYIPGDEVEDVKQPQAIKRNENLSSAEDADYTIDDDEEGPGV